MLRAHVEATLESSHSNGPPGQKCYEKHGHSWLVEIEWEYTSADLDAYGWGIDFGAVKKILHEMDHKDLNTIVDPPSAEYLAMHVANIFNLRFAQLPAFVRVTEGRGNTVTYTPE